VKNALRVAATGFPPLRDGVKQMPINDLQELERIEKVLAHSVPFGDSDYILQCTWQRYERRLEMLIEHMPSSETLLAAIRDASSERKYRVIGDPVLRGTINEALGHYKLGLSHPHADDLDAVMLDAVAFLAEDRSDTPVTASFRTSRRLGDAPHHGWLYYQDNSEGVFSRSFVSLWGRVTPLRIQEPTEHHHRTLMNAARLLDALLPALSRSALSHTQMIVMVEPPPSRLPPPSKGFTSVTFPELFGTIVLAPTVMETTWLAAEYLLHESMHLKFTDLEHTHSLLRTGYRTSTSPIVRPPWHRPEPSRNWPVNRCLTVMHVYVTLALFFSTIERRAAELENDFGPLGDLDPALEARRSFDRSHFLGRALRQHEAELGLAGVQFVRWLTETINAFDPCPPPADAEVHLLLDMYGREADELQAHLDARVPAPSVIQLVEEITTKELNKAHDVLLTLGKPSDAQVTFSEKVPVAAKFRAARAWVKESLGCVPIETYSQTYEGKKTPAELVQELIDGSGDDVQALYTQLASA